MADRDPYPSEKQDRFIVRLPDGMRDRIKAAAEENKRSMNAEIVQRLEDSFDPVPGIKEITHAGTTLINPRLEDILTLVVRTAVNEALLPYGRKLDDLPPDVAARIYGPEGDKG